MTDGAYYALKLEEAGIPFLMRDGLVQYIMVGRPVGHFLTAVLENNLKEACARADPENAPLLCWYIRFLYNVAPIACWGSSEAVEQWMNQRGMEGLKKL